MKTILIDFDGCVSDGRHYIDHRGDKMFYSVHSRDNTAIAELIYEGFRVVIVTANDSKIIKKYAEKRKCEYICTRDKSIKSDFAIGDSVFDIPMLKLAGKAFCPVDADEEVKKLPGIKVLPVRGGNGVISFMLREIIDNEHIPVRPNPETVLRLASEDKLI